MEQVMTAPRELTITPFLASAKTDLTFLWAIGISVTGNLKQD